MISALFKTERNNNSALNSVLNFNILVYILTLTVNSQQQILFFCQDTRCFYWICPIDCLNITPKMLVFFHTTVCLKLNCLWKLFNVQVLSELNGISAMFFFVAHIVTNCSEANILSTSFRQGVIEDPLDDLAAAPISSTNTAAIFPDIWAQDPVTAHMLHKNTNSEGSTEKSQCLNGSWIDKSNFHT